MRAFRPKLTYANVVSTLCLFIVLGGGAWAATRLPKNSVGTPQLKKNAVTGAKVKNGSLTGADIDAATLGRVPQAASAESATNASHATSADSAGHAGTAGTADHATSADTATQAGDATTLDGLPASAFLPAGRVSRISSEARWESEAIAPRPMLDVGPFELSGLCDANEEGNGRTLFELEATGAAGSTVDYSRLVSGGSKVGVFSLEPSTPTVIEIFHSFEGEPSVVASMTLVYRDSARTISIPLGIFVASDSDTCRVTGSATVAE